MGVWSELIFVFQICIPCSMKLPMGRVRNTEQPDINLLVRICTMPHES